MPDKRHRTQEYRLPFLLLLVGVFVRLFRLFQLDLWYDEALQIFECLSYGLKQYEILIFHPPLNNYLLLLWMTVSTSSVWLKLLPILWGTGTLVLTYLVTRKVFGRTAGNWALCLLALMPLHIYYSRDFRMYSMQTFFVILSWYAFLKLEEKNNTRWMVALIGSATLAFYSHYFSVFPLTALGICSLLLLKNNAKMIKSAACLIGSVILFYPWIHRVMTAADYLMNDSEFFAMPLTPKYMAQIGMLLVSGYSGTKLSASIAILIFAALALLAFDRSDYREKVIILSILVFPIGLVYLFGVGLDYNYLIVRYVTFLTPGITVTAGAGLSKLNWKLAVVPAALILLIASFSNYRLVHEEYTRLDLNQGVRPRKEYSEPAAIIAEKWQPSDVIGQSCISSFPSMYYYLEVQQGISAGHVIDLNNEYQDWVDKTWQVGKYIDYYPFIHPLDYQVAVEGKNRLWFIASEFDMGVDGTFDTDFTRALTQELMSKYRLIEKWSFYGCPLYLFDLTQSQ